MITGPSETVGVHDSYSGSFGARNTVRSSNIMSNSPVFCIIASRTAIWCGEDGWDRLTAMLDCFDRSRLGWSMTPRCRARDFSPAMAMAWSTAWPYGPEAPATGVLRHDNGTQFASEHYCEVAQRLGIKLSRTRYRHPD
jgi:transposase InsO family protein